MGKIKNKSKSKLVQQRASSTSKKLFDNATAATVEEEESTSSIYDSILSTCGCYAGEPGNNQQQQQRSSSVVDGGFGCVAVSTLCGEQQPDQQHKQQTQDANANNAIENQPTKIWDRLSDMALYLIGATPPVKFVKCFECSSVDESEVTMPRALSELADDYDSRAAAIKYWRSVSGSSSNMWSVSEGTPATSMEDYYYTDRELDEVGRKIDNMVPLGIGGNPHDDFSNNNGNTTQRVPLHSRSRKSSRRWDRLKLSRSTSGSRGGSSRASTNRRSSRSGGLLKQCSSHTESYLNDTTYTTTSAGSATPTAATTTAAGYPIKSSSSRKSRGSWTRKSNRSSRGGRSSTMVEI